jgi:peptidoglycan/xylan/chitin deacetylase (PgdA/CDA1 family)
LLRLDRFLTLGVIRPLRKIVRRAPPLGGPSCLPILMYHGVSDGCGCRGSAYYCTVTSRAVFSQQMTLLRSLGYQGVSLEAGLAWLADHKCRSSDDRRSVVLTFDDGFRNVFTEANPILQKHGFSATVFLPTDYIHNQRRSFKGMECLTWGEVRELREQGILFGSHTVSHPKLVELCRNDVRRELRDSRRELEQRLGESVTAFAFPFAFPQGDESFVSSFRDLLAQAGYTSCVTTEIGRVRPGDDLFRLKRLPVNTHDDSALLRSKLSGDYDWMAVPQGAHKQLAKILAAPASRIL